jgi:hypothetical protein
MSWKDACFAALHAEKMFEDSGHRTRFKELLDCYADYPFFSKGLCKCMYLSAWDEEHFCIMLEVLMDMSLGKEKDTGEMRERGDLLAEEQKDGEYYVYQLSNSFLDGTPFLLNNNVNLDDSFRHIIQRALRAAEIIDSVSEQP